jgi:hypothetical protein
MSNSSDVSSIVNPKYDYRVLFKKFTSEELEKFSISISTQFEKIVWTDETYSEWKTRTFLSIKMCLASTVLLSSLIYSKDKNLKVIEPYLLYYSLLNCSRAFLSLYPTEQWNNGEMIKSTHSKIINCATNYIQIINKEYASDFKNDFNALREYREAFSYMFPSDGLDLFDIVITSNKVEEYCILLLEFAQYSSEILSRIYNKKNVGLPVKTFLENFQNPLMSIEFCGRIIISKEDWYRLDYIARKHDTLYSLHHTMSEGMIEDFFGAWCAEDEKKDVFNPDASWQLLFDIP